MSVRGEVRHFKYKGFVELRVKGLLRNACLVFPLFLAAGTVKKGRGGRRRKREEGEIRERREKGRRGFLKSVQVREWSVCSVQIRDK